MTLDLERDETRDVISKLVQTAESSLRTGQDAKFGVLTGDRMTRRIALDPIYSGCMFNEGCARCSAGCVGSGG